MKKVEIALVGIGGYGRKFVSSLLAKQEEMGLKITGVIQPDIRKYAVLAEELKLRSIPVFSSLQDFFAEQTADLTVISSPIQYHAQQTCLALRHGSNVLCEKPACSSVEDAGMMEKAAVETGKFVAVGYQLSFHEAILKLKNEILLGKFGRAIRLKTLILASRSDKYYTRNKWAGRITDDQGNIVLDSIAHNCGSHNIHNMLYMLGEDIASSAAPAQVTAELCRAYDIQNYDTAAARIMTDKGAEILFYGTHSADIPDTLKFSYEFENGTILYEPALDKNVTAVMKDGTIVSYGSIDTNPMEKLWTSIRAARGECEIPCGIAAATPEVVCINAMQRSAEQIVEFPRELLSFRMNEENNETFTYVQGLDKVMKNCYKENRLFSEMDISWAKQSNTISI